MGMETGITTRRDDIMLALQECIENASDEDRWSLLDAFGCYEGAFPISWNRARSAGLGGAVMSTIVETLLELQEQHE